jgi:Na+-transporting NADH:ubiquinone oxidoreductase subunit F
MMSGSVVFVIITSIVAFMVIVLILVSTLLYARAKLTAVGLVKININGEKDVTVNPGGSLLSTLSESGIFLPSACGGGGRWLKGVDLFWQPRQDISHAANSRITGG